MTSAIPEELKIAQVGSMFFKKEAEVKPVTTDQSLF
jgi:hypothetical protein